MSSPNLAATILPTSISWRNSFLQAVLITAVVPLSMIIGTWAAAGRMVVEKLLTALVMPMLLVWLAILFSTIFLWLQRQRALALWSLFIWLIFTIASSPLTSYLLYRSLESGIAELTISEVEPLTAIVVLGGGTTETPQGRATVGRAGDRVILAAELYHASKVKKLITTGENISGLTSSKRKSGAEQTRELWAALGVDENAVIGLGGRNTTEEMLAVKQWIEQLPAQERVGIITSAWHMPRALRLAKKQGLELVPIPADFAAANPPRHLLEILPSGGALGSLDVALKEYLAALLGR